jgi:hypothetical protein
MAVVIPISTEDIEYAKTFITQYLEDQMPNADFSEGTALQDLVVQSFAHMFAFLRAELAKVQTLRSLSQLQTLQEDDEVRQAVDDIISNFLINRGSGAKAQVGITITLSQQVDLFVPSTISFNRDGTHIFYPISNYDLPKEDLIERVSSNGLFSYEADITLVAQNIGEDYEVPPGNFVSWDVFNPYVTSVRNTQKGVGGSSIESNDAYIERSNDAITVRNLINPKSIRTVLMEEFASIGLKDVTTIGYGDPEMLRDTVNTNVTWTTIDIVHIGNHQDIYLNLPLTEFATYSSISYTEQYLGEPDRPGAVLLPQVPIYKIHSVRDTLTQLDLPYHTFIRDHRYVGTKEQEYYIILDSGLDNIPVTVTYDTVEGFDVIHNYLRDPDERITLANSLARAVIPVYIEMDIYYIQVQGQKDLDTVAAKQTIVDYITSLSSVEQLYVDSIVLSFHQNYGTQAIIKVPQTVKGTVYYPDGTLQEFYSENLLTVPEYPSLGVTNRVCGFITTPDYIRFYKMS